MRMEPAELYTPCNPRPSPSEVRVSGLAQCPDLREALEAALGVATESCDQVALRALLGARGGYTFEVTSALVQMVEDPRDSSGPNARAQARRRMQTLCIASASCLVNYTDAAMACVAAARAVGAMRIIGVLSWSVVQVVSYSNGILRHIDALVDYEPPDQLAGLIDAEFWERVGALRDRNDAAVLEGRADALRPDAELPRNRGGRLCVPVGRSTSAADARHWPCPTCQDCRQLRRCACGLEQFCSDPCQAASTWHSCSDALGTARALVRKLMANGGVSIAMLSEGVFLPLRARFTIADLSLPVWYPNLAEADHVQLYRLHPLIMDAMHTHVVASALEAGLRSTQLTRRPE